MVYGFFGKSGSEKKLSVLKPYFEDDSISVNTGVGAVQKSVQEFEADLLAFQNGKSSADLGYGDNFDLQAYYDNILDGCQLIPPSIEYW